MHPVNTHSLLAGCSVWWRGLVCYDIMVQVYITVIVECWRLWIWESHHSETWRFDRVAWNNVLSKHICIILPYSPILSQPVTAEWLTRSFNRPTVKKSRIVTVVIVLSPNLVFYWPTFLAILEEKMMTMRITHFWLFFRSLRDVPAPDSWDRWIIAKCDVQPLTNVTIRYNAVD